MYAYFLLIGNERTNLNHVQSDKPFYSTVKQTLQLSLSFTIKPAAIKEHK